MTRCLPGVSVRVRTTVGKKKADLFAGMLVDLGKIKTLSIRLAPLHRALFMEATPLLKKISFCPVKIARESKARFRPRAV